VSQEDVRDDNINTHIFFSARKDFNSEKKRIR